MHKIITIIISGDSLIEMFAKQSKRLHLFTSSSQPSDSFSRLIKMTVIVTENEILFLGAMAKGEYCYFYVFRINHNKIYASKTH